MKNFIDKNFIYWWKLNKIKSFMYLSYITSNGNGTPLQYSCLENPMDGGAW